MFGELKPVFEVGTLTAVIGKAITKSMDITKCLKERFFYLRNLFYFQDMCRG